MPFLQFLEYERQPRAELGKHVCAKLQRLDERMARHAGETIFDWSLARYVRAQNYVGVLQEGDLQVEILPKTDTSTGGARKNLVYMMSVAGQLPWRERDLAGLGLDHHPILDALGALFAQRLLDELRRGLDRAYVRREENGGVVRGKLVLSEHIKRNAAHRERVYVAYDELLEDTWLNRILKAACRVLLQSVRSARLQQSLKEALLMFADVADVPVRRHDFARVRLTRNSARFEDVYAFAKLVLRGATPAPRAGADRSFSLLVPMDRLFEEFIGQLLLRHAPALGYRRSQIHLQARGKQRHLLRASDGRNLYRLKPDVLIEAEDGSVACILDTKWKAAEGRPSDADMYQLYAYAQRYEAPLSVLLYPRTASSTEIECEVVGASKHRRVRAAHIDLSRDIRLDERGLVASLSLYTSIASLPLRPAGAWA